MRLFEFENPVFYHGSRKKFAPGFVLRPQASGYVTKGTDDPIDDEAHFRIEAFLEAHRPSGAVPRAKAVFMTDVIEHIDPLGGYTDFVYSVQPVGPVTKCNGSWYGALYEYAYEDEMAPECVQIAQAYWSAAPAPQGNHFEYLATTAKVLEIVEEN